MIRVLVTGKNGQLGQCFQHLESSYPQIDFIFKSSKELNITSKIEVDAIFESLNSFDYCINCAAYTAVDKAEIETDNALNINVNGPKWLAKACKTYDVKLIHISTDFVFDGHSRSAYKESDPTNPLGVYGKTKCDGEKVVANILEEHFIVRTSWLYSEYGSNFLKTMLRLSKETDEINVVGDQFGSPTYALDLARAILKIIEMNSTTYGLYHYSNSGVISWYDFAKEIFRKTRSTIKLNKITTKDYPTPAKRPQFSALDSSKIETELALKIPFWEDSLDCAITSIRT